MKSEGVKNIIPKSVVLNWGQFCSSGEICEYSESFLVVTTRRWEGHGVIGIYGAEVRDAGKHPIMLGQPSYNKELSGSGCH